MWPEACATPTKEAINVAEFLNDLILCHGCPDIISDQGTEFCNQVCPQTFPVQGLKAQIIESSDYCENGIFEY